MVNRRPVSDKDAALHVNMDQNSIKPFEASLVMLTKSEDLISPAVNGFLVEMNETKR